MCALLLDSDYNNLGTEVHRREQLEKNWAIRNQWLECFNLVSFHNEWSGVAPTERVKVLMFLSFSNSKSFYRYFETKPDSLRAHVFLKKNSSDKVVTRCSVFVKCTFFKTMNATVYISRVFRLWMRVALKRCCCL